MTSLEAENPKTNNLSTAIEESWRVRMTVSGLILYLIFYLRIDGDSMHVAEAR
jgi:hypothetical protein